MPNIKKVKPKFAKMNLAKVSLNLPHVICNHVIGKEHTIHHRIAAGVIMILTGVIISKVDTGIIVVHWVFEALTPVLHGFGTIPFIEYFSSKVRHEEVRFEELVEEELGEPTEKKDIEL